jgi:hypothetical protein
MSKKTLAPNSGRFSPPSTILPLSPPSVGVVELATPAAACFSPHPRERVGALLFHDDGAHRETLVRRGRGVLVRWHFRGEATWCAWSVSASWRRPRQLEPQMGLGGPCACVIWGASWRRRRRKSDAGHGGDGGRLVQRGSGLCGASLDPTGPSWDWCASAGALRACCARPDLTGTGVPCCRVRWIIAFGGGGCSLPHGCGTAGLDSCSHSHSSCKPRDGSFSETTMTASWT